MNAVTASSNLVFNLGTEEYAIDIALVRELRGYGRVTRLADAPPCMVGVVNLRGAIVPLVDLRIRLGRPAPRYDETTVVIILAVDGGTTGIVVDGVADVMDLVPEQIKPPPRQGVDGHVLGVAAVDERLLMLLDIGVLLRGDARPVALAA